MMNLIKRSSLCEIRTSRLDRPAVINAHRRYNPIGSRVEPPTREAQAVGKLFRRKGLAKTLANYSR